MKLETRTGSPTITFSANILSVDDVENIHIDLDPCLKIYPRKACNEEKQLPHKVHLTKFSRQHEANPSVVTTLTRNASYLENLKNSMYPLLISTLDVYIRRAKYSLLNDEKSDRFDNYSTISATVHRNICHFVKFQDSKSLTKGPRIDNISLLQELIDYPKVYANNRNSKATINYTKQFSNDAHESPKTPEYCYMRSNARGTTQSSCSVSDMDDGPNVYISHSLSGLRNVVKIVSKLI